LAEAWRVLVEQGTEALLAGRFGECERLAALAAAASGPADIGPGLLSVAACREQGRAAEAEIAMRALVAANPDDDETRALLAAVLGDLGRDSDARRQLEAIDLDEAPLPVCALAAETAAVLRLAPAAKTLLGRIERHASESVGFHGPLARHLGLLTHALGDWHAAAEHLDAALAANRAAGAPVLVAHTCSHLSAVLRLRGRDGDWDRAVELLDQAAHVYRRLEIDSRAEESETVLRRSLDPTARAGSALRRHGDGWDLSYAGQSAHIPDSPGVGYVANLVASPGRPLHALELMDTRLDSCLRDQLVAECRSRLRDLAGHATRDPVAAALARAEADRLQAELTAASEAVVVEPAVTDSEPVWGAPAPPGAGEVINRARRLVTIRVRVALERIEEAVPELGRHLRRSVRTGTFCLYEPVAVEGWKI
jgi:tetratricopeptide (TPR) repeat protein